MIPTPRTIPADFSNTTDFLFLPEELSAKRNVTAELVSWAILLGGAAFAILLIFKIGFGFSPLSVVSASIALFYFVVMAFKLFVIVKARKFKPVEIAPDELASLKNEDLPVYTILIPLYREEKVIGQILKAMTAIDYPTEKLDIIITLEEYDHWTENAIREAKMPAYFKSLILPNVTPKTKPKALNVALSKIRGEFLVIYDAEIMPDPDQLKKAVLAFRRHPEIASFQTRLDHYNTDQNIITRLFNAEFSFYYDWFLPGLQRLGFPIPLSGHSTHFRAAAVKAMAGWDPYNVTEDCDVGIRLYRAGYRTGILDSVSREEATTTMKAWIMQRTRWMKGFIQTSVVHLRDPWKLKKDLGGWKNFVAFLLIVPATVLVNIINLFAWIMLFLWITTHARMIQSFFPTPVLYISNISFVTGTFIFTYFNLVALYERRRFELVKYGMLSPFYWMMLAAATVRASIQVMVNPYRWEKTTHGTHLKS